MNSTIQMEIFGQMSCAVVQRGQRALKTWRAALCLATSKLQPKAHEAREAREARVRHVRHV